MYKTVVKMNCLKLTVLCLVLCTLKCAGMSLNELEEFSNFLQTTSQLDEILKKGTSPDDDYDEDELISDHAWEDSGKFEGDLILNERQRRLIVEDVAEGLSRNGLTDSTKRWPDNEVIYYIQKEHFSGDQVDAIRNGIEDLARASCVKFRPYKKGDRDAVVIQGSRRGCFSQVGYQGGYQVLNLSGRHPVGRGCFRHGTVVHELLHTLGFYHMQSSPDRDDYINVVWENIVEPAKHNFRKYNTFSVSDFGVGYDYDSVLHYSRRAFSANGRDTLVPKQNGASIGQRVGLSDKDAQKLNKMYCDSDNNDAAEETPKKPPTKKKKPKNKPFEGHGIGYHQGKAVVIKLPAAETYNLADTPTSHVFDHFSKTPQTVSSTALEGTGVGEKITQPYDYKPYQFNSEDFENPAVAYKNVHDETEDKTEKSVIKYNTDKKTSESIDNGNNSDDENHNQKSLHDDSKPKNLNKFGSDLDEAFERLGKIIKTHVYPSHAPDLDIYRNVDYSKFYTPERKYEPEPEIVKVDKAFVASSDPNKNKDVINEKITNADNKTNLFDESVQSDNKLIQVEKYSSQEPSSELIHNNDNSYQDYDSSYGTTYPYKKYSDLTEKRMPQEHLADEHYYRLYDGLQNKESFQSNTHIPSDFTVHGHKQLYNEDDIEKDSAKYDKESYTYGGDKNNERMSKILMESNTSSRKANVFGRLTSGKPYSLFGVLVPLTQKWYRVNYNPQEKSFSIEDPEYSEDYR